MRTFLSEFEKGKLSLNRGLPLGEGLVKLDRAINGLQRGVMIGIGSSPKVGKI